MKLDEGQLNFFDLLNEYEDDQGAHVRVRKPVAKRAKKDETPSMQVKDGTPNKKVVKAPVETGPVKDSLKEPPEKIVICRVVAEPEKAPQEIKEPPVVKEIPIDKEPPVVKEPIVVEKPKPEKKAKEAVKIVKKVSDTIKEAPVKEAPKAVEEVPVKEAPKAVVEDAPVKASSEILFKQCKKCWCFDCKHNSRNEGVPRDLCGNMMPCPACKGCIDEDMATVCEIGNAKEGCRLRATEEGLVSTEEDFE